MIQVIDNFLNEGQCQSIIYLNDDFEGDELEFENEKIIIPKKGMMVYFADEKHKVYNCIGKRWCLVGFLNNDMFSKTEKK